MRSAQAAGRHRVGAAARARQPVLPRAARQVPAPERALSADEFAEYAREQTDAADEMLAAHGPASSAHCCRCGRPAPCSQANAIAARQAHYRTVRALAEPTVWLPLVTPSAPPPPPPPPPRTRLSRLNRPDR